MPELYAWAWPPLAFDTGLLLVGQTLWWLNTRQRRRIERDFVLWTREMKSKDSV